MRVFKTAHLKSFAIQVLAVSFGLMLAGCSNNANTGAPAAASQSAASKSNSQNADAVATEPPAPKSVFTIDQNSRDPFYPKAKRAVAAAEGTRAPEPAVDLLALLQTGFQGVIGNKETRIALINNVMLEPGRQTEIPIYAAGQSRHVSVRCREVLRDAVVLEVQGYPQPVKLVRPPGN